MREITAQMIADAIELQRKRRHPAQEGWFDPVPLDAATVDMELDLKELASDLNNLRQS